MTAPHRLGRMLAPDSVAVVGASNAANGPGNDMILELQVSRFPGAVYAVNPKHTEVEVWPCGREVHRGPRGPPARPGPHRRADRSPHGGQAGHRHGPGGRPRRLPADVDSVVRALVALSDLIADVGDLIAELVITAVRHAGPMRFTEHELTTALTGAAKTVLASRHRDVRRGRADIDTVWDGLSRLERFTLLDGLGDQILPTLVALPDVEVAPGTQAYFSDRQVRDTVEAVLGEGTGRLRRAATLTARTALVRSALEHLPPRTDPDTLTVPDHL